MTRHDMEERGEEGRAWWATLPPVWKAAVTIMAATAVLFGLGVGWTVKAQVYSTLPERTAKLEYAVGELQETVLTIQRRSVTDSIWQRRTGCLVEAIALKLDPIVRCGL